MWRPFTYQHVAELGDMAKKTTQAHLRDGVEVLICMRCVSAQQTSAQVLDAEGDL